MKSMRNVVPGLILILVAVGLTFATVGCEAKKEEKKEESKKDDKPEGEGKGEGEGEAGEGGEAEGGEAAAADTAGGEAAAADTAAAPEGGEPAAADAAAEYIKFNIMHADEAKGPVDGSFAGFKLTSAVVDLENLANSTATFEVDISTVDTAIADRDTHLKSPDFFDVAAFPNVTFTIKDIQPEENGAHKATAAIGVKGITKDVPVEFKIVEKNDDGSIVVEGSAKLNREELTVGAAPAATGAASELTLTVRLKLANT